MLALLLATVIHSTTNATASTGGNSSDSGGSVVTGSAHASSEVSGSVNGGSGTVTVEATATANGETSSESKTVEVGSHESVDITVDVSAQSESGTDEVFVGAAVSGVPLVPASESAVRTVSHETGDGSATDADIVASTTVSTSSAVSPKNFVETVFDAFSGIASFVGSLFNWFGA